MLGCPNVPAAAVRNRPVSQSQPSMAALPYLNLTII